MFSILKYYSPAFLWAGFIAFLSLTNAHNLPQIDWDLLAPDKVGHFSVYAILNFLVLIGFFKTKKPNTHTYYIYATIFTSNYGILMEYLQFHTTPDRQFEYPDMIANILGAIIGLLIFKFFWAKK